MKYSTLVVGALASVGAAHSDPRDIHAGIPKMLGGRKLMAELRAENALPEALKMEKREPVVQHMRSVEELEERQISTNGQCGPGFGHCPAGQCCSIEGWCGNGIDYCAAPDCQFLYGPACDANTVPSGPSTAGIARPALGTVPYGGAGIYDCAVAGGKLISLRGKLGLRLWHQMLLLPLMMDHTLIHRIFLTSSRCIVRRLPS